MILWLKIQWQLNHNWLLIESSLIISKDLMINRKRLFSMKEINKSLASNSKSNFKKNKTNYGRCIRSITEDYKCLTTGKWRENKEKLLRTPKILMCNKCRNICKNGKTHTMRKDHFENANIYILNKELILITLN